MAMLTPSPALAARALRLCLEAFAIDIPRGILPSCGEEGFEHELERQILVSERRRARILAWILGVILLLLLIGQGAAFQLRYDEAPGWGSPLAVLVGWIGLEWLTMRLVSQDLREDKRRSIRPYISAVLEVALPTVGMLILCHYDDPFTVLTSSVSYAYFLIIILSPLRLDAGLCVFNGALAAIGYGILVSAYWEEIAREWPVSAGFMYFSFFMRGVLLFAGGLAAGFVSRRIRTTLVETLRGVRERERVVALFGQHVSPVVVSQLLAQPAGRDSEQCDVCVMVLDIRNFTTFSEAHAPDEVVRYLNTLWSFMVRTVNEHGGIVNKFLGDGFLAVFGAPLPTSGDCANALAAARSILAELDRFAAGDALPPTQVGIALHFGPVIVGNVGSTERKEYTVIGDVVNVAFRIEALNKEFESRLLISEPVRRQAGLDEGERIPPIAIRGRRDPVDLFRLA
jgi:adenylate cyclase